MDPRQSSSASPYASATSRSPFPPQQQQQQPPPQHHPHHQQQQQLYQQHPPPPHHPQSLPTPPSNHVSSPAYSGHQRRPSDAAFPPHAGAARPPLPADLQPQSHHVRAQSASSIPPAREFNRAMPPPNSPPQPGGSHHPQHGQPQHHHQGPPHSIPGAYGPAQSQPPPPRASHGPPSGFGGGRELPPLGSIARSGSGSSMSISSMLGGPPPASREGPPTPGPPQHYPTHSAPPPGSGPGYAPPIHASPRMQSASEFPPFRRPQTPEHQREHQRGYDSRAGSAAQSPRGPYSTTPDVPRYGTPQTYHSRHPSAPAEPPRDMGRVPASAAPPPRPSSQPKYPGMQPRPVEGSRMPGPGDDRYQRRDEIGRPMPGPEYNPERPGIRGYPYEDRYKADMERQGEIERRERAYSGGEHRYPPHHEYREPPREQPGYGRPPDPRDARDAHWGRQGPDSSFRAPMDHQRPPPEHPHPSAPPPPGQPSAPYPPHSAPYQPPHHDVYASAPHLPHSQGPPSAPMPAYDSPDRARMHAPPPQSQPPPPHHDSRLGPRDRPGEGPAQPSITYNSAQGPPAYEPPRQRNSDDLTAAGLGHPRHLLAVQQENRKGRISPLPQAVQGVQPQQPGPAAEPGIKSEFGRMFSGIGSGVGGLGVSSPNTSTVPGGMFTNAALAKRDDTETVDSVAETNGKTKGRRRKLKDEDSRDDDSSGRLTPGAKAKRSKGHQHHHHQYV